MSRAGEDGLINSVRFEGDPVRSYEPAVVPVPAPHEGQPDESAPEQPTIVRGQD